MFSYLPKDLKEMVVEFVDTKELLKFPQINHELRQFVLQNGPFSKTLRELVIFADGTGLNNELYPETLQICMKTKEAEYTFRDSHFDLDIKHLIYFIKKIRFCQEISIVSLNCPFSFIFIHNYPRSSRFGAPDSPRKNNGHLEILNFLPAIKNVKKWTIFQTELVNLSFLLNNIDFGSYKELTIGSMYPTGKQILVEDLEKPIDCKGVKVLNLGEIMTWRIHLERLRDEIDELPEKMIQEMIEEEQSRLWAIDYLKKERKVDKELARKLRNHLRRQREEIDELEEMIKRICGEQLPFWAFDYLKKEEDGKELAKKTREKLRQEKKIWKQQKRDVNRSITFKREKYQRMKRQNFHRKQ